MQKKSKISILYHVSRSGTAPRSSHSQAHETLESINETRISVSEFEPPSSHLICLKNDSSYWNVCDDSLQSMLCMLWSSRFVPQLVFHSLRSTGTSPSDWCGGEKQAQNLQVWRWNVCPKKLCSQKTNLGSVIETPALTSLVNDSLGEIWIQKYNFVSGNSPFSGLMSLCTRESPEPFQWWQWCTAATSWAATLWEITCLVTWLQQTAGNGISLEFKKNPFNSEQTLFHSRKETDSLHSGAA